MRKTMKLFVGRISLLVIAGATVLGSAASLTGANLAAEPAAANQSVVADGQCPVDMHWSIPLNICVSGVVEAGLAAVAGDDSHW